MLGTWTNVATVLVGTVLGRLFGSRIKRETQGTITDALGCVTLLLGIQNAMTRPDELAAAPLSSRLGFFLVVLVGVLLGSLLGEGLDIEARLHRLGQLAEERLGAADDNFGKGFVAASLVFCVGPLTVLGSFADGLKGDYSLLVTKAVLDFFAGMAFAAALGWGVALSAVTVLVVQGALTLGAGAFAPVLSKSMVDAMTAAGGIVLMALGIRLLDLKPIRVANMVPALVVAPFLLWLVNVVRPGFFPMGH
jgi:uncharacterized membrane protein YqgA involved in biofilm formation